MSLIIPTKTVLDNELAAFNNAGSLKTGLPPSAYTSDEFWEAEKASLLPNSWVFVAFAHEMEKSGDTIPVTVGDSPLILVRNQDGSVKAFHNVCRHRCVKLVDSPQNVGRLLRLRWCVTYLSLFWW